MGSSIDTDLSDNQDNEKCALISVTLLMSS